MNDSGYLTVIISLIGFLQTIFMFILAYLFKVNGTLFSKLDDTKSKFRNLLDENTRQDNQDRVDLEKKITNLLDNHYVTTGMLTTLEEKLLGEINGLSGAIRNLTDMIKNKL